MEKLQLADILFIQGMKDYLQIHTVDKKIMTLQTFKLLQDALPASEFIRVHLSYMVSVSKIERIERNRIKIGNEWIPISESYKEHFFLLLRQKNIVL